MQKRRVLVVEDNPVIRDQRAKILTHNGYEVRVAESLQDALERFREASFPVVVTDLRMPGGDGLAVAESVKAIAPHTMIILITATCDQTSAAIGAVKLKIFDYIEKGSDSSNQELLKAIDRAFAEHEAAIEKQKAADLELRTKKEMLAFLTHTMRNTFAGAPAAVEQVLRLGKQLDLADPKTYKIFSNLAFLRTSFSTVDAMLDAYKLLIREPDNLRTAWRADSDGSLPAGHVVETALASALGRLLFHGSQINAFERLASSHGLDRKRVKSSFLEQILVPDSSERESIKIWLESEFPVIKISGEEPSFRLSPGGIRYSLLYSITSELIFNSLKYSDGREQIRVYWQITDEHYILNLENSFNLESRKKGGSQKGREFIKTLLKLLDGITVLDTGQRDQTETLQDTLEGRFATRIEIERTNVDGGTTT